MNGSGVRDTARVLGISINTVISELKKRNANTSNKCGLSSTKTGRKQFNDSFYSES